jgi:hypothetical protein
MYPIEPFALQVIELLEPASAKPRLTAHARNHATVAVRQAPFTISRGLFGPFEPEPTAWTSDRHGRS